MGAMKNDVQKQVDDTNKRVKDEETQKSSVISQQGQVLASATILRDEIKQLENNLANCEEDKTTKDNQIRTLREEIAHQEDMVSKLTKEKRSVGDTKQKTEENIQSAEDKCNHLNKVKA